MLGEQPEGPEELCEACHLMYQTGLIYSAGGNASVRVGDDVYITPTGGSLGQMRPEDLVQVRLNGEVIGRGRPSKELGMHLAMYRARPDAQAVVHPHPPHAVAFSVRYPTPRLDAIPPSNAGFYVRAGQVPLLPYFHSGSHDLHEAVTRLASDFNVILLGNHGLIAAGPTLLDAINIVEEIEQNCHILLLAGDGAHVMTAQQRAEVDQARHRTWPDPAKYAGFFDALQGRVTTAA
ncbi:MAG TPA: class II aldolase family protein [Chloroflexi bacterium]|nr:class II aldolase family protein [Chloroflexota bacterium]